MWIVAMGYLGGWLVAGTVVFLASKRLCEPGVPTSSRVLLSVIAGLLWPLVVLGAFEFGWLAVYARTRQHAAMRTPVSTIADDHAEQTWGGVIRMR